jgi:acetyltransferase-like isoleucine patch superfamily enzyme
MGEHPFTAFWLEPGRHRRLADALFGAWSWVARMGTAGPASRHARRFGAVGDGAGFSWPPGPTMNTHLVRIGAGTLVGPEVGITVGMWAGEDLEAPEGWIVRIGERVNVGRRCTIAGRRRIDIGDDVTFAADVYVTDHNHRYDDPDVPVARQWVDAAPVVIGAGSWLGARSVVLPGTTLGRNVVVAAGAVVRGEVPDHAVVAGVPARVVRRLVEGRWEPPVEGAGDEPPAGWR